MKLLQRAAAVLSIAAAALAGSGCTTTLVVMHAHHLLTEGDPTPCANLNSVERALRTRCGPFVHGSLLTKDVAASGLPQCPLTLAARDPQLWPVLPELLAKGAQPESCVDAPLVALAQRSPCPAFESASREELQALRWLAEADARSIHHDVMRALSCPSARNAGLTSALDHWLAQGLLPPADLPFSPLSALHPQYLGSPFAQALEAQGHTARAAFGGYAGKLAPGFEEALRTSEWSALDWWLARMPELASRVPATQAGQLAWLPLARVLTPAFMPDAEQQRATVAYLLAHGADPWKHLPHEPGRSVVNYARAMHSPLVALLDPPPRMVVPARATPVLSAATAAASPDAVASMR